MSTFRIHINQMSISDFQMYRMSTTGLFFISFLYQIGCPPVFAKKFYSLKPCIRRMNDDYEQVTSTNNITTIVMHAVKIKRMQSCEKFGDAGF